MNCCCGRASSQGASRRDSLLLPMAAPIGFHALPLPLAQLSLQAVLKCGQSFRWSIYPLRTALPSDPSHEYRLCLRDRVVCLRQSPDTLFYRAVFPDSPVSPELKTTRDAETLLWLRDYFQLDVDLVMLYNEWSEKDPVFAKLRGRFEGIRVLRQDPWENLISYALLLFTLASSMLILLPVGLYVPRITTSLESRKWSSHFAPSILHLSYHFRPPRRLRPECRLHPNQIASRFHGYSTRLPRSSAPPCSIISPSCTQMRTIFSLVDIPSSRVSTIGAFARVSLVFARPRRLPPPIPRHTLLPHRLSRLTSVS